MLFFFQVPSLTDSDRGIKYWIIHSMSYLISWVKVKLKQLSQIMRCQAQQLGPRRDLKAFYLTKRQTVFFKHRILRDFIFQFHSLQKYHFGATIREVSWKIGEEKSLTVHQASKISKSQLLSWLVQNNAKKNKVKEITEKYKMKNNCNVVCR